MLQWKRTFFKYKGALPALAKRWHPTLSATRAIKILNGSGATDGATVFMGKSETQRGQSAVRSRTRRTARSGGFGPLIFLSAREFALGHACNFESIPVL